MCKQVFDIVVKGELVRVTVVRDNEGHFLYRIIRRG
jgi:hypothetical protein